MIPRPSVSNLNDGNEKMNCTEQMRWVVTTTSERCVQIPPPRIKFQPEFCSFSFFLRLPVCALLPVRLQGRISFFTFLVSQMKKKILFFFFLVFRCCRPLGFSPRRAEFDGTCVSCRHSVMSLPPSISLFPPRNNMLLRQGKTHPPPTKSPSTSQKPNGIQSLQAFLEGGSSSPTTWK